MKINIKTFTSLVALFVLTCTQLYAAAPPPPSGAGCWPPPCIPIDGGISFLIAAGIAYGGKKAYNSHKSSSLEKVE